MLKSEVGIPSPRFTGQRVNLAAEARRARHRLYPMTAVYSAHALLVLALGLRSNPLVAALFCLLGWLLWTLIEYLAHRFVLHWRFPDGPGLQHLLHRAFDGYHGEHHARPWDGNHINGSLRDTGLFAFTVAAVCFLAPIHTLPVLWAGVLQAYVVEEWVHQSTHFPSVYRIKGRYFRYINRHHLYHHSPRGAEVAFGLSSGLWDFVLGTRVPERDRRRLFAARAARASRSAPHGTRQPRICEETQ
jgi:4-hydroxysphinganine ceramide fatty acyl 2-hydroxylase